MSGKNSQQVIIKGKLIKKSGRNFTWATRYCVMNSVDFSYYNNRDHYLNKPTEPLGRIFLKHIFNVIPLKEKEKG
jgi:adenylate cyclase 10